MKMVSVVGDGGRKTVRAPEELLESCWTLADQEMMLDVAAIMAATPTGNRCGADNTCRRTAGAGSALLSARAENQEGIVMRQATSL